MSTRLVAVEPTTSQPASCGDVRTSLSKTAQEAPEDMNDAIP